MGDRIQAAVVSTSGGLKLSRKLARAPRAATTRKGIPGGYAGRRKVESR